MAQRSKKKSFDQTDLKQENHHHAHKKHSKTKGFHNGDMHHDMNGGMIIENGSDNGSGMLWKIFSEYYAITF